MARPPQKKQKLTIQVTTPTKSAHNGNGNASSTGKGKRKQVLPRRDDSGDEEADETEDEDDDEEEEEEEQQGVSMAKETTGDNYFHRMAEKNPPTSSNLLSTSIDPAFSLSSYSEALSTSDTSTAPELVAQREILSTRRTNLQKDFGKWMWEMECGFNIMLYGFGSKKDLMNRFAEKLRRKGNVVVVNGYDAGAGLGDVVEAMEGLLNLGTEEESTVSPRKGKGKGKGKAKEPKAPLTKVVSAIEGRIRRFCRHLSLSPSSTKDIYLVIHSLDGPALRSSKSLSLLALLAAQPRLHLIASVDHLRAPLLFPTSLATARPVPPSTSNEEEIGTIEGESLAFTWVYHSTPTLAPFTSEVISTSLLSSLLPPSIYPPTSSLLSSSSTSLAQSTIFVLQSVSIASKKLFSFLSDIQSSSYETQPSSSLRTIDLNPPLQNPSPPIAISIKTLQVRAQAELIAVSLDKLEALLSEFKDHGVVRSGTNAPEGWENEDEEEDSGGKWVWIPLERDELEEVRDTLEGMLAG